MIYICHASVEYHEQVSIHDSTGLVFRVLGQK